MRKLLLVFQLMALCLPLFGQSATIDQWRASGYQANMAGDFTEARDYYQKIIEVDPEDYDALLALARINVALKEYRVALKIYNRIYCNDTTDVEALNGMAICYTLQGKTKQALDCYEKTLIFLPDNVPQLFVVARAYGNNGKSVRAITIYQRIIAIDSTYAEAWSGIGRMYYWDNKPRQAMPFYKKALAMDPLNREMQQEYQSIRNTLRVVISLASGPIYEAEESYTIKALVSKLKIEKRTLDLLSIEANVLVDFSDRQMTDSLGDVARWYTTGWLKGGLITRNNTVYAFGGYSTTDHTFSSYGVNWKLHFNAGALVIKNTCTAAYDYFYYWNKVGAHAATDELSGTYKRFGLSCRYTIGLVDPTPVKHAVLNTELGEQENPFSSYGVSCNIRVCSYPEILIGANHSYISYTYTSPLYYTPLDRTLTGPFISFYLAHNKFYCYGSFAYNFGNDFYFETDDMNQLHKVSLNMDNWSSNMEIGYSWDRLSISIGGNNFYNPFYRNFSGLLAMKILI